MQATLAQFGIRGAGLRVGGFSAADPQGDSLTQLQTALFQGDRALYSRQDGWATMKTWAAAVKS